MIVSFFESIKYVGHLVPVAVLRMFVGYFFLNSSLDKINGSFLAEPRLASMISEGISNGQTAEWFASFLETVVTPNWQVFAHILTYCEFVLGVSLLIGFFVRPISLVGILLCLNAIYGLGGNLDINTVFIAIFVTLAWLGAGRSLGIDYFFYKRQRGIWW